MTAYEMRISDWSSDVLSSDLSFYARKHPYFSERDVLGFAALMAVHPAIVVGQLQKRMKRFDYLRKYQVPIRRYLPKEAVADGWGNVPDRSEERGVGKEGGRS